MTTYTVTQDGDGNVIYIVRNDDGASIPVADGNRDYTEFLVIEQEYPENITYETAYEYIDEGKWADVRSTRNQFLTACDWTQLPDSPKYQDETWLEYRQSLRDITTQTDVDNIIWPEKPEV